MDSNIQNGQTARPKKTDRIEVVKVLIIAFVSFAIGFGIVIFFFKPTAIETTEPETNTPPASNDTVTPSENDQGGYAPTGYAPPSPGDQVPADDAQGLPDQGSAAPEVPPGRTPAGIALDGSGFYLKCWNETGMELPGESCDKLPVLEKRFSTRLYVVDKCKKKLTSQNAKGKLSLGLEIDYGTNTLSYWNGASSDLENASKVAKCLRTELAGLPIDGFDHKMAKYRIFFTILFGAEDQATSSKPKPGRGKLVNVLKDRVRVRKSPVTGEVIGHISTGNEVRLLGKKDGWCNVLTPNNNEGWMTCEALGK